MTGPPIILKLGPMVEKLTQRSDLFQILRQSHLRWMNETDDLQIKEMHRSMSKSLHKLLKLFLAGELVIPWYKGEPP